MILKSLLTYFCETSPEFAFVLDIVLGLTILSTREIKLILFYLVILIIALVSELFIRQISLLEAHELTALNIEKLAQHNLELHSNIRLAI